jgi:predicted ATPase/class 3 adenylate cyclase
MAAAPEGTVTLMFTDIEGSTSLLRRAGDGYAALLLTHRRLLRDAFVGHGGYEVGTEGDSFFVAFPTAAAAAAAALQAQEALRSYPWPTDQEVHVRMGLHTGEPRLQDDTYIGLDVHHAARVMAAGHGGQVLLTQTTRELLHADLPIRDLGHHRLKDLSGPQRLFQLGAGEHPPLKTLHRSNVPVPVTPFVGREKELAELSDLLARSRLVTLTGPGGTGKTRLALQAAAEAAERFPGGIWFVGLAAINDAAGIAPAVALALGVTEETLAGTLATAQALIVLDNLEQIDEVGTVVADLLANAPEVVLVATSRGRLGLLAEQEYPVPTLDLVEAVELFTARARRVRLAFEPDDACREICRQLDGLPLAVELAAGRTNVLTTGQILERLGSALDLLATKAPDTPPRQRTLRATIDWSFQLLLPAEAAAFAGLAAFAGSFDLDAAEQIGGAALDEMELLTDKNLVRATGDGRFFLYETLREYARERLVEHEGRLPEVLRSHAAYYCALAEQAAPEFEAGDQLFWFDRVEAERANIRSALDWSIEHEPEIALRIVGALGLYWSVRGPLLESVRYCERALTASTGRGPAVLKAMLATSYLTNRAGNAERARELAHDAAESYRRLGEQQGLGRALRDLSNALTSLDDWTGSQTALEESADASRTADDQWNLAIVLNNLGYVARGVNDLERAIGYHNESVTLRRTIGDWRGLTLSLQNRSYAELELGRLAEARTSLREAIDIALRLGYREGISGAILPLGILESFEQNFEAGIRLISAAKRADEEEGLHEEASEQRVVDAALALARSTLDTDTFDRLWGEGADLSFDEAAAIAVTTSQAPQTSGA